MSAFPAESPVSVRLAAVHLVQGLLNVVPPVTTIVGAAGTEPAGMPTTSRVAAGISRVFRNRQAVSDERLASAAKRLREGIPFDDDREVSTIEISFGFDDS